MITRNINNIGRPITAVDGTPLEGVEVSFTLVKNFIPTSTFDALTGEYISEAPNVVKTDANGEFSVDLWPTSRGELQLEYVCKISHPHMKDLFSAPLLEDSTPISLVDFKHAGGAVTPAELTAFALHNSDYSKHLTPQQNDALDAANNPSVSNPYATIGDLEFAGGHIHNNKEVLDGLTYEGGVLEFNGEPIQGAGGSAISDHNQLTNIGINTHTQIDTALFRLSNTSGTNTGDETATTIRNKLGITTLVGSNTGDETSSTIKSKLGITTLTGDNTGDETSASIKSKLGVSILSGSNTGDQDLSGLALKSTLDTHAASTTAAHGGIVASNDPRLTDSRNPLAHTQAWSTITNRPTTISGYGITDAALSSQYVALEGEIALKVDTSSLGTAAYTSSNSYATAPQGAKADAIASAVITPSGDASGVTDLANIQAAINALPNSGGCVYLVNSGSFYLPSGSTGIQLGNGTNSSNSTKHGIRVIGIGKGGTVNGKRGGVIINSAVAGPAIQVNGPVSGWEVDGIEVNITSTSTEARGIKVVSAQAGSIPYFACDISNPSQIAVEETTTTNTGAAGSNTMHNKWGHVHVWMSSAATNAIAWKSTGAAYPTFNTCNETVDNLEVYTNHSTQSGIVLAAADTVSFRQFILWNSGVASKGIVFDYANGQSAGWPADCTFFSLDIGTSTVTNNGTPAGATKNKIFGMGLTNGGALPSIANLYVGDAPSLTDLADWPSAVSAVEVGYLDGVTSSIQTQINNKAETSALPSTATSSVAGLVTVSGNTTKVASVSGTLTQGKQATFDINGNLIASSYDTGATGGGAVNWGGIGGTLSNQTDLNSVLSGKQDTLVNQTNIKSINGSSLLGSGDLTVSSMVYPGTGIPVSTGSAWGTSLGYGFGANKLLQLNSDGNFFLKATNGTNTQFELQARNSGGTIVSDWVTSATVTPQYTIYDVINGHNVMALTPGAPENSFAMDSTGKIGFGTGSPLFALHSLSSASQGAVLLLEDYFTGNGASGGIFGRFGRGSATSPLRGKANDRIFTIGARSAYAADDVSAGAMPGGNRVAINFFNAEDQTSSAQGSYISLLTTAPGTVNNSEKMRINGDGSIQIGGTYGAGFGAGNLSVLNGVLAKTFAPTVQVAATDGATVTFDLSLGQHPSVTLGGNRTLAFTNPQVGTSYRLTIKQDASGNRTVSWPTIGMICTFIKQDGTRTTVGPTLHTTANAEDTIIIIPTSSTTADCYARGY